MQFQTADLWDEHAAQLQCLTPIFKQYGKKECFAGKAITLKIFEDNSLVREILGTDGRGKVLVVDGGGSLRCALVGDRLALKAIENGWEGIIVYGCIRDSAIIKSMDIGIKAINTCPVKSIKRGVGLKGEILKFAGTTITPTDYIYSDVDGVLVSADWLLQ